MATFSRIQNRIYYGYTKAAQHLGTEHAIYRSTNGINPIDPSNFIDNRLVWLDHDFTATKAKKYGDPTWQFTPEDGLTLQNFDYMVGPTVTYFIVDIAPDDRLTPPLCIECNTNITITRHVTNLVPGKNSYQEYQPDIPNVQNILLNVPASLLQHTRVDSNNMKLPTSVKLPYYSITVPDFDAVTILTGDMLTDDDGRRLSIISAEMTKKSLGLRIIAVEQGV